MSDSVRPHRWQPTRLPRPWDSPGKNTGVGCHLLLQCVKVKSESEVTQSCPTLSHPMDCSLPGSSVHGIFQARVLDWGAIAFSIMYSYGKKPKTNNLLDSMLLICKSITSLLNLETPSPYFPCYIYHFKARNQRSTDSSCVPKPAGIIQTSQP